jgi:hypothetical protein
MIPKFPKMTEMKEQSLYVYKEAFGETRSSSMSEIPQQRSHRNRVNRKFYVVGAVAVIIALITALVYFFGFAHDITTTRAPTFVVNKNLIASQFPGTDLTPALKDYFTIVEQNNMRPGLNALGIFDSIVIDQNWNQWIAADGASLITAAGVSEQAVYDFTKASEIDLMLNLLNLQYYKTVTGAPGNVIFFPLNDASIRAVAGQLFDAGLRSIYTPLVLYLMNGTPTLLAGWYNQLQNGIQQGELSYAGLLVSEVQNFISNYGLQNFNMVSDLYLILKYYVPQDLRIETENILQALSKVNFNIFSLFEMLKSSGIDNNSILQLMISKPSVPSEFIVAINTNMITTPQDIVDFFNAQLSPVASPTVSPNPTSGPDPTNSPNPTSGPSPTYSPSPTSRPIPTGNTPSPQPTQSIGITRPGYTSSAYKNTISALLALLLV